MHTYRSLGDGRIDSSNAIVRLMFGSPLNLLEPKPRSFPKLKRLHFGVSRTTIPQVCILLRLPALKTPYLDIYDLDHEDVVDEHLA